MVTVHAFELRKNAQNEDFIVLILQGGLEIVHSKTTGKPYAKVSQVSIPATFDEATAKRMIGSTLSGIIEKKETEPYDYTVPETGEVLQLTHNYIYNPAPNTMVEVVQDVIPA